MMNIRPLEVTLLRRSTFSNYYTAKKENGAELHCRKPPRMDAPDDVIRDLVRLHSQPEELVLHS